MAELPQAPRNLIVNRRDDITVLVWDKVIQDVDDPPQYTDVIAYYVSRTGNPARRDWDLLKIIITTDPFNDIDTFYIDYAPGNYLYRVCAENAIGIGPCAIEYGIISVTEQDIEIGPCLWDEGKFDECLWAP